LFDDAVYFAKRGIAFHGLSAVVFVSESAFASHSWIQPDSLRTVASSPAQGDEGVLLALS
jgi:hypothetical protein